MADVDVFVNVSIPAMLPARVLSETDETKFRDFVVSEFEERKRRPEKTDTRISKRDAPVFTARQGDAVGFGFTEAYASRHSRTLSIEISDDRDTTQLAVRFQNSHEKIRLDQATSCIIYIGSGIFFYNVALAVKLDMEGDSDASSAIEVIHRELISWVASRQAVAMQHWETIESAVVACWKKINPRESAKNKVDFELSPTFSIDFMFDACSSSFGPLDYDKLISISDKYCGPQSSARAFERTLLTDPSYVSSASLIANHGYTGSVYLLRKFKESKATIARLSSLSTVYVTALIAANQALVGLQAISFDILPLSDLKRCRRKTNEMRVYCRSLISESHPDAMCWHISEMAAYSGSWKTCGLDDLSELLQKNTDALAESLQYSSEEIVARSSQTTEAVLLVIAMLSAYPILREVIAIAGELAYSHAVDARILSVSSILILLFGSAIILFRSSSR